MFWRVVEATSGSNLPCYRIKIKIATRLTHVRRHPAAPTARTSISAPHVTLWKSSLSLFLIPIKHWMELRFLFKSTDKPVWCRISIYKCWSGTCIKKSVVHVTVDNLVTDDRFRWSEAGKSQKFKESNRKGPVKSSTLWRRMQSSIHMEVRFRLCSPMDGKLRTKKLLNVPFF